MFWFMNHLYNPVVRWILQSPLHGLMSKGVLLIAFTGKKSGKEYITPVQYVRSGKTVWIMVGFPEKKVWWKNLVGGGWVRVCIQGIWQEGNARAILGSEDPQGIQQGVDQFIASVPQLKDHFSSIVSSPDSLHQAVFVKVQLD